MLFGLIFNLIAHDLINDKGSIWVSVVLILVKKQKKFYVYGYYNLASLSFLSKTFEFLLVSDHVHYIQLVLIFCNDSFTL